MSNAAFQCIDLTTFHCLGGLGSEVVGQFLEVDCAVIASCVVAMDHWCRKWDCERPLETQSRERSVMNHSVAAHQVTDMIPPS